MVMLADGPPFYLFLLTELNLFVSSMYTCLEFSFKPSQGSFVYFYISPGDVILRSHLG